MTDLSQYMPPPVSTDPPTGGDRGVDVRSALASEWTRDRLHTIAVNTPRARQARLGPSEIGQECPRRLAYRIAGTPIVNWPDPLKAMFGSGMHAVIAAGLIDLEGHVGRYLVEHRVTYRDVTGSVDLYDRWTHRMTDWKTTALNRIRKYQASGVPANYAIQAWIYAEGLRAAGEDVATVALTFIPRDGTLTDVWTWTTTPNAEKADRAIERYQAIAERVGHEGPAALGVVPSALCAHCPNYRPSATDLSIACPGKEQP
jgi:hypothetical protein